MKKKRKPDRENAELKVEESSPVSRNQEMHQWRAEGREGAETEEGTERERRADWLNGGEEQGGKTDCLQVVQIPHMISRKHTHVFLSNNFWLLLLCRLRDH